MDPGEAGLGGVTAAGREGETNKTRFAALNLIRAGVAESGNALDSNKLSFLARKETLMKEKRHQAI